MKCHHTTPHHTINSGTINNDNSGDTKGQGVGPSATSTPLVHEWGEHEIDYMMFLRMKDSPMLNLNPEEVSMYSYLYPSVYHSIYIHHELILNYFLWPNLHCLDLHPYPYRSQPSFCSFCYQVRDVRYVSLSELQDMMNTPGLQWSPWFALIVRDLLTAWWKDLETTMMTDKHVNLTHIHRLF